MKAFFISHSSKQKPFVEKLLEGLGKDKCIVDKYDFEPGYKTHDEIERCMDSCALFVLLISKESLVSDWVNEEVRLANQRLKTGKIRRILPYIIDERVKIEDTPDWIKDDECFNLKLFLKPKLLARELKQKYRAYIWDKDDRTRLKDTLFVGWNDKIDEFQSKLYSGDGASKKAMILSGREGIGKERFFYRCIEEIGTYTKAQVPFVINVDSKSSIEDVIIQLNAILERFITDEELTTALSSSTINKTDMAVSMINELYAAGSILWIYDKMGCVRPDRNLSDWFESILTHPKLEKRFGLFLFSVVSPHAYIESRYRELIHIQLMPMSTGDRKKLFYKFATAIELASISEKDADVFVSRLLESPEQLMDAVLAIKNRGMSAAKLDLDELIKLGEKKGTAIIDYVKADEIRFKIAVVLSKVEFLNVSDLQKILEFDEDMILKAVLQLKSWSLVEMYGPDDMYIQLDSFVSDYFQRNRLNRDKEIEHFLDEVLSNTIREATDITEDVSAYLYEKRKSLLKGDEQTAYLIPHLVIKAIIEIYNKRDWQDVVKLCDRMLNNNHNVFPEIIRETKYWLCLALAREKDQRFFDVVKDIDGADNAFLKGFYFRNNGDFSRAYNYYADVLESSPTKQRARREMVIVLLSLKRYEDALELAKENYYKEPSNSYHINAYFRCLVKKVRPEKEDNEMMMKLLNEMEKNDSPKRASIYLSMKIEYDAYVEKKDVKEILPMITKAQQQFPDSLDIKRVANDYHYYKRIVTKPEFVEEDAD